MGFRLPVALLVLMSLLGCQQEGTVRSSGNTKSATPELPNLSGFSSDLKSVREQTEKSKLDREKALTKQAKENATKEAERKAIELSQQKKSDEERQRADERRRKQKEIAQAKRKQQDHERMQRQIRAREEAANRKRELDEELAEKQRRTIADYWTELKDVDAGVRRRAANELERLLGDTAANHVEQLIRLFDNEKSRYVKGAIANIIANAGPNGSVATQRLAKQFHHPDRPAGFREECWKKFIVHGCSDRDLAWLVESDDYWFYPLYLISRKGNGFAPNSLPVVDAIIHELEPLNLEDFDGKYPQKIELSFAALRQYGELAAPALPMLEKELNRAPSPSVIKLAASIGPKAGHLADQIIQAKDTHRKSVAFALGRIAPPEKAVPVLIEMLDANFSNHAKDFRAIVDSLSQFGLRAEPAVDEIYEVFVNKANQFYRPFVILETKETVDTLGRFFASVGPKGLAKLSQLFAIESELAKKNGEWFLLYPRVFAETLRQIPPNDALQFLENQINKDGIGQGYIFLWVTDQLQVAAATHVKRKGSLLCRMLEHENHEIRSGAAKGLSSLGDKSESTIAALKVAARDSSSRRVRNAASNALEQLKK